jgi:hypothetical protein
MKKNLLFVFFLSLCVVSIAQIGIGTNTPDSSAQLDVFSNNKGFLPPRIALVATNVKSPVTNPATGLLVYNTATQGTAPNNVKPGYYYWNGTQWYPVVNKGNTPGDMQYWDGTKWIVIPIGPNGSVLTVCNGIPTWGGCPSVAVSLSPANNPFEGMIDSYIPTLWSQLTQIDIASWTNGGAPENRRMLIKFDYSSIPSGVTIDSAKLYLYSTPNPQLGNFVDAQFGVSNSGALKRITSPWTVSNQYNWMNQPTSTINNQVELPQSITSNDNAVLSVGQLVKDMISFGNNGFLLQLQTEVTYNIRQYVGSSNTDVSKRPKLVIWYH